MRARALASVVAVAFAVAAAGCGGVQAADLFIVTRTGGQGKLLLLVNEEGGVHCNGRYAGKLDDQRIVKARAIAEDLEKPSSEHLSLAPAAGSVYRYHVRDEQGQVTFSDNSPGRPKVLSELSLFVLETAQQLCKQD